MKNKKHRQRMKEPLLVWPKGVRHWLYTDGTTEDGVTFEVVPAPVWLSELVGAVLWMAVQWRVAGGRWMEEPWGEEERAASELDSRTEAWDTASSQFGEECVSSMGDTRATIALAIQEWDDQQQRAETSREAAEAEEAAVARDDGWDDGWAKLASPDWMPSTSSEYSSDGSDCSSVNNNRTSRAVAALEAVKADIAAEHAAKAAREVAA